MILKTTLALLTCSPTLIMQAFPHKLNKIIEVFNLKGIVRSDAPIFYHKSS
jgi:hypothetical protein